MIVAPMEEHQMEKVQTSHKNIFHNLFTYSTTTIVFKVPATREMVQSLLDPNERKSWFDFVTLTTLLVQISFYFVLPLSFTKYLYIALFLFWRLAYNLGLGLLLKYQSENRFLVKMVKKYKIFDTQENPKVAKWLRTQLSLKMHADYDFDVS